MPSSTSSSKGAETAQDRVPNGPWLKTWAVAFAIMAILLGGMEIFWRARGFQPSVKDNAELWSQWRSKLDMKGENSVVLIGSSRTQVGVNPRVLAQSLGDAVVVQLAIDGSSPIPVLQDLAEDQSFGGVVICEVAPTMFFGLARDSESKPSEWLRRHRGRSLISAWEVPARAAIESHCVVFLPQLSPAHLLESLLHGELPGPHYVRMEPDRLKVADFSTVDRARVLEKWRLRFTAMGQTPTAAELRRRLASIDACVRSIQRRGGEVVFLHMVSSDAVREVEERRFPRHDYWDVFARSTSGVAIHYADVPSLSAFICGDGSHLDGIQAQSFSKALAAEMSRLDLSPQARANKAGPQDSHRHARQQQAVSNLAVDAW